ncbi:hypothetical protein CcCBS67573_g03677 [Chytriomyces confervae]|uniref:HMG box domain-containing protein n=1 Tax=Chytriomyces confervae TaxID=246404 RepID=A0A507FH84_9FUNG|nr:hypothetical protein HDU80_006432 [Chytriomyces hyalinus]TPX75050.1 hypothetical protein CcCBS67573_g03677 [Chytriomyces confervae]
MIANPDDGAELKTDFNAELSASQTRKFDNANSDPNTDTLLQRKTQLDMGKPARGDFNADLNISDNVTSLGNHADTGVHADADHCIETYKNQVDTLIEAGKRLLNHEPVACLLVPDSQPVSAMALPPVAERAECEISLGTPQSLGAYTMGAMDHSMSLSSIGMGIPRFGSTSSDHLVYWGTPSPGNTTSTADDKQQNQQVTYQPLLGMYASNADSGMPHPGSHALQSNPHQEAGFDSQQPVTQGKKRSRTATDHTPRPSNSFMIYRREKQAEILAQYRGQKALHNNAISKVVADMWREESPDVRAEYAAKAETEKLQHMLKYPGYKYTPRRGAGNAGAAGSGLSGTSSAAASKRKTLLHASKSEHVQLHLLPMPSVNSHDQMLHHGTPMGGHHSQQTFLSYSPIMAATSQAPGFPMDHHFVAYTTPTQNQQIGGWPYQMVSTPRFIQVPGLESSNARIIQVQGDASSISFDQQHQAGEYFVPTYIPQFTPNGQVSQQAQPPQLGQQQESQGQQQLGQYRPWGASFSEQS